MLDNVPLGNDSDQRQLNELAALFDAPAYIRRARLVESEFAELCRRCDAQREEWLDMVRLRLGRLFALAGQPAALVPLLENESGVADLQAMFEQLQPKLRLPPQPTVVRRVLRDSLLELIESLKRFNHRWERWLLKVDVSKINTLRDGYNRYYVLEKACALRSDLIARRGFEPLPMLDHTELLRLWPLFPVPVAT